MAESDRVILGTPLEGVRVFQLKAFTDARGYFKEIYNEPGLHDELDREFVQDNSAYSTRGTLRGMHFQDPHPQGKLITALTGEIFDAMVDLRPHSSTFGKWCAIRLSGENGLQMYVPEGCAHGYLVTSNEALVHYKCTAPYHAEGSGYLKWDDPTVGIEWPEMGELNVSERDLAAPGWDEIVG